LLTVGEIVQDIFSTSVDAAIHALFNALPGKLRKCGEFVTHVFSTGQIICDFVENGLHIRDLAGPCEEEKNIFNHTDPTNIFISFYESELLPEAYCQQNHGSAGPSSPTTSKA
jgi:hypothetical protein